MYGSRIKFCKATTKIVYFLINNSNYITKFGNWVIFFVNSQSKHHASRLPLCGDSIFLELKK
jgi:hypothetical protein